jgi:hypothetical protein
MAIHRHQEAPADGVSFREYIDHIYRELQGEMDRRFSEQRAQVSQTAADLAVRLGGMNEFRDAMGDIAGTKVGRDLFDQHAVSVDLRLRAIEDRLSVIETGARTEKEIRRKDQAVVQQRMLIIGAVISVVVIVTEVIIAVIQHIH